jgi:hypothetical protein
MRDASRRNTPVYCWIRKVGEPVVSVIVADSIDWRADERRLIAEARARGDRLLNIADGGDEPFCSPAQRAINGKQIAANRPPHVMRAFRRMESNIRSLKKMGWDVAALSEKLTDFKRSVADARRRGYLSKMDAALGKYFEERDARRTPNQV